MGNPERVRDALFRIRTGHYMAVLSFLIERILVERVRVKGRAGEARGG